MSSRDAYRAIAEDNLSIFNSGGYATPDGTWNPLQPQLNDTRKATVLCMSPVGARDVERRHQTRTTLGDEETLAGIDTLRAAGITDPCILNFASARSPGGGG
jgi:uncharacterized protein (TIGR02452 family)